MDQAREHSKICRVIGFCAFCELERHVNAVFSQQQPHPLRPQGIVVNIKKIAKRFRIGRQEDSHEFIRFFIDALQSALTLPYKDRVSSPRLPETTLISRIFGGYLRSQVKCTSCGYESNTYDPFLDMSLEVKGSHSLHGALQKFCSTEILDGANKYKCDGCKKAVRASKSLRLEQVPPILTVQLKRFYHNGYSSGKVNGHIEFPVSLDLRKFCTESERTGASYSLYAVLVHQGHHAQAGHYYSFVKSSNGVWYQMDDTETRQVSQATVLGQHAYILFYQREQGEVQSAAARFDRPLQGRDKNGTSSGKKKKKKDKQKKRNREPGKENVQPTGSLLLLSKDQRAALALSQEQKAKLWASVEETNLAQVKHKKHHNSQSLAEESTGVSPKEKKHKRHSHTQDSGELEEKEKKKHKRSPSQASAKEEEDVINIFARQLSKKQKQSGSEEGSEEARKSKKHQSSDEIPNGKHHKERSEKHKKAKRAELAAAQPSGEEESRKRPHPCHQPLAKRQKVFQDQQEVDEFDAIFDFKKAKRPFSEPAATASLTTTGWVETHTTQFRRSEKQQKVLEQLSVSSQSQFGAEESLWEDNPQLLKERQEVLSELEPAQSWRSHWDEDYDQGKLKKTQKQKKVKRRRRIIGNPFQRYHQSYNQAFRPGKRAQLSPRVLAAQQKRRDRRFKEKVARI